MLKHANYFKSFRNHTIGNKLVTPQGKRIVYADWTASGRLYRPIEDFMSQQIGPYIANTHSESNLTGATTTAAYDDAKHVIREHVNAGDTDLVLFGGAGMTAMINKLQRMLGLKSNAPKVAEKPLVLITHMEHHSNQISWQACDVHLEIIPPDENGLPDLAAMEYLLDLYQHVPLKIGSFTACSNVTGIMTPYHKMAEKMHLAGGICLVDFAASAPYVDIDMHPQDNPLGYLDGIFISPHKFLGGPGSSGLMVINQSLVKNAVPDHPGGGTVKWSNPWGEQRYLDNVEAREDGGTPGFLQAIRTALAIKLKNEMTTEKILAREASITEYIYQQLTTLDGLHVLAPNKAARLCVLSFYIDDLHHNLVVKLLNDKFGIQARGGCSCAGTYGHVLLNIDRETSKQITDRIDNGHLQEKPGWVRISFHPINTDSEVKYVIEAIKTIVKQGKKWRLAYLYNPKTAEYVSIKEPKPIALLKRFKTPTKFESLLTLKLTE